MWNELRAVIVTVWGGGLLVFRGIAGGGCGCVGGKGGLGVSAGPSFRV
jgi:hypothetical protein